MALEAGAWTSRSTPVAHHRSSVTESAKQQLPVDIRHVFYGDKFHDGLALSATLDYANSSTEHGMAAVEVICPRRSGNWYCSIITILTWHRRKTDVTNKLESQIINTTILFHERVTWYQSTGYMKKRRRKGC